MDTILEARNVTKSYRIGDRRIDVLSDVSLSITAGEIVAIQGASGSGKTTLLSLLSGLDRPSQGRVLIEGNDITDITEDELAPLRNRDIGYVFQSFHLVPSLSALENVMFPAEIRGDGRAEARAVGLIERVGMTHRMNNFPHQLSGGEKQRIAICRALVNDPNIIFADEPTGNLDSENGKAILELLTAFQQEQQATLVLVTHSEEIAAMAGRALHLTDGRIRG